MEKKACDGSRFTIFELVADRTIIATNGEMGLLITWNDSITFQVWKEDKGMFSEVDMWVTMETLSLDEAKKQGKKYLRMALDFRVL